MHEQQARALFLQGYNCAQSVFAAFCDVTGLSFEQALALSSSFGAGMGRLREVCGALSAAFLVAGARYGYTDPTDDPAKRDHYALIQQLAAAFEQNSGSIFCYELLGLPRGAQEPTPQQRDAQYYAERPCLELVAQAARMLDELLESKQ